jgi:hypothetical protein
MMGKIVLGIQNYDGQNCARHLQIYDGHLQDAGNAQICAGLASIHSFLQ